MGSPEPDRLEMSSFPSSYIHMYITYIHTLDQSVPHSFLLKERRSRAAEWKVGKEKKELIIPAPLDRNSLFPNNLSLLNDKLNKGPTIDTPIFNEP